MALAAAFTALPASAETTIEAMARAPERFDPVSGYRTGRYRAPTPDDIPGAERVDAEGAAALIGEGALLIDVTIPVRGFFDPMDERWITAEPRMSLPGAVWVPAAGGYGAEPAALEAFRAALAAGAPKDAEPPRPVVIFCIADCWMGWNAARRAADWGWARVYWFREGTDGWVETGRELAPVIPVERQ